MNRSIDFKEFEKFMKGLFHTVLSFKDRMRRQLAAHNYDLSPEQVMTMFAINSFEGLSMSELAEKSPRDKTTMTRMIDGLEKQNLVVRVPDKSDRRQILIYLTSEGKAKINEVKQFKPRVPEVALKGVSMEELQTTSETLRKIRENLYNEKFSKQ